MIMHAFIHWGFKSREQEYGGITNNGDTLACLCHKERVSNETMHIKMVTEILI